MSRRDWLRFTMSGSAGMATLMAASAPSPLYPVYQRLWGFSAFTLTAIFAIYVFALLASLLTVGSLSDVVGRRPVVCAALLVLAVGMLLFSAAGGTGDLLVARVVQGVAVGAATSATTALISDSAPSPQLGSVVSSAAPPLGIAVGAVLAGALVQFAPDPRRLVFWVLAAVYALIAVAVWLTDTGALPTPPPGSSRGRSIWRSLRPSAAVPRSARSAFLALVPSIAATWALGGLYLSLGSSILGSVFGIGSHFVVGLALGAFFAMGACGSIALTFLPPRLRAGVGYATLAAGVLATVVAVPTSVLTLYVAGSVVAGFGFGASFRLAVSQLGDAAPSDQRGQVFATMFIVSYLAFSVPALAAGLAAGRLGLATTAVAYGSLDILLVLVATIAEVRQSRSTRVTASDATERAGAVVARTFESPRHRTTYLECGPADGPLMFLLHGWPGLGLMWRAQLEAFAADGFRCIAPDMRGYGGSGAPAGTAAYAIEEIVIDMVELHEHLGGQPAIWVGHDWGSIVAGSLAAHEPYRCRAAVLTSWAYFPDSNALCSLVPLVDRTNYAVAEYPDGQWDYYRSYTTHFQTAVADLDADPAASLASIYRSGSPDAATRVSPMATVTRDGGRFGAAHRAPWTEPDPDLWPTADFEELVRVFNEHGFGAPCAWYTNDDANLAYARRAPDGGRLSQPVLFVNGDRDAICTIEGNRQGDPMRAACADLTVHRLPSGHWLPLECGSELTAAIRAWLRARHLEATAADPR